jgi:hypothetical protein
MYCIYLIESIEEGYGLTDENKEMIKNSTVGSPKTPESKKQFMDELDAFIQWKTNHNFKKDEVAILWIVAHGTTDLQGIVTENGDRVECLEIADKLHRILSQETIVFLSSCWGGIAGEAGKLFNWTNLGPRFIFGPSIAVNVPAINEANVETLKLLEQNANPDFSSFIQHIDNVNNSIGQRSENEEHSRFYYGWCWENGRPKRHPEPDSLKVNRVEQNS